LFFSPLLAHTVLENTDANYQCVRKKLGTQVNFFNDIRALTRYPLFRWLGQPPSCDHSSVFPEIDQAFDGVAAIWVSLVLYFAALPLYVRISSTATRTLAARCRVHVSFSIERLPVTSDRPELLLPRVARLQHLELLHSSVIASSAEKYTI
jgi:hypothetical protein